MQYAEMVLLQNLEEMLMHCLLVIARTMCVCVCVCVCVCARVPVAGKGEKCSMKQPHSSVACQRQLKSLGFDSGQKQKRFPCLPLSNDDQSKYVLRHANTMNVLTDAEQFPSIQYPVQQGEIPPQCHF